MEKQNKLPQINLSKREKILITIMFTVLIVIGGGIFIILPEFNNLQNESVNLKQLQLQELQAQNLIKNQQEVKDINKDSQNKLTEIKTKLSPYLANHELDSFITELVQSVGLEPVNLTIILPELDKEKTDESNLTQSIKEYTTSKKVSLTVVGNQIQLLELISKIYESTDLNLDLLEMDSVQPPEIYYLEISKYMKKEN